MGERKLAALAGLVLLLATVACASPGDGTCKAIAVDGPTARGSVDGYRVLIASDAPADKAEELETALERWQQSMDRKVSFTIERASFDVTEKPNEGELRIFVAPQPSPSAHIGSTTTWDLDSRGRPLRALTWVDSELDARTTFLVALHEVGHALGLAHSDGSGRPSIMAAVITDTGDEPTPYDRMRACALWSCEQEDAPSSRLSRAPTSEKPSRLDL